MAPRTRQFNPKDAMSDFLAENVWLPMVALTAALLLLIILIYCIWRCRNRMRFDYSILKEDLALPQKLEMERKLQYDTMRETALLHGQFYLRSSGLYTMVEHLPEIGNRVGKHWFIIRDVRSRTEKLLTMCPRGPQLLLPFTPATQNTLLSIFQAVQHPYVFPLYDVDLLQEQDRVVIIMPFNSKGSLKDAIYHSHWQESWSSKYYTPGAGLPLNTVAIYTRQVVEGMLFLQRLGFPPHTHLHSGNIILQNNTCRIAGYENEFIGLTPKNYGMTTRKIKDDKSALEVICLAHLVYEMTMGNELDVALPQSRHLAALNQEPVRQFMEFIFRPATGDYPTLEEISEHPFLKAAPVRELEVFERPIPKLSRAQKLLLRSVRKGKALSRKRLSAATSPKDSATRISDVSSAIPTSREMVKLKLPSHKPAIPPRPPLVKPHPLAPASPAGAMPPPVVPPAPVARPHAPTRQVDPAPPSPPSPASLPHPPPGERTALLSEIRRGIQLKSAYSTGHPRI